MPDDPRQIYAAKAAQALAANGRTPRRPIEFRSQCGEDALLWELLQGQLDGFYIEVGAFNGYDLSSSYAFDCVGWSGLLIEAIPERHEECLRRRPDARVVHAALGAPGSPPTADFVVVQDEFGGMLSHVSGLGHTTGQPSATNSTKTVTVPVTTMNELLKDHKGDIDFAVIDVEGAEVPLLQGFDLRRFRPRLLLIEDTRNAGETPVSQYMAKQPYSPLGWIEFNRIYARADIALHFARRL